MGVKVMIVDDSMMVRQQVARALLPAGFELVEAKDGIDGLEKIRAASDVALIVCDVNMPRMDGLALLEALRADPAFAHVLVLMLTTEGQPELVQRARTLGAKGWIVKPFKPELLVATIKKLTARAA